MYKYKNAIPVGCVPPAHYRMGGLCLGDPPLDRDPPGQRPPWTETPWTEIPQTESPLDRDPWTETPQTETPSGQRSPLDRDPLWTETLSGQRPLSHVTCGTCWDRDPPVKRITDRCKTLPCCNIIAGGNKVQSRIPAPTNPRF